MGVKTKVTFNLDQHDTIDEESATNMMNKRDSIGKGISPRRDLTLLYYKDPNDQRKESNDSGDSSVYIDHWLEEQILNQVFQTS